HHLQRQRQELTVS
nr:immunoglobulin heavy chain junction region [Homo sapiens]